MVLGLIQVWGLYTPWAFKLSMGLSHPFVLPHLFGISTTLASNVFFSLYTSLASQTASHSSSTSHTFYQPLHFVGLPTPFTSLPTPFINLPTPFSSSTPCQPPTPFQPPTHWLSTPLWAPTPFRSLHLSGHPYRLCPNTQASPSLASTLVGPPAPFWPPNSFWPPTCNSLL